MYPETIQKFIDLCQWDTAKFFFISENVFDPFIYYSHLVPLILSLVLGFFVFFKSPKLLTSRILFFTIFSFSLWVLFDLILWANEKPELIMSLWSSLIIFEVLIYASTLYFVQVFITQKDTPIKNKLWVGLLILPILIFLPTNLSLIGFDLTNCEREAFEGPLALYGYFIQIIFAIWIVLFGMSNAKRVSPTKDRNKIILITVGSLLFLLTFSWGNIVGSLSDDWRLPQWGLFGMPIFIGFLAYLIVKYGEFNIKLIGAQALMTAIFLLIGSEFFFIRSTGNRILVALTLLISSVIGLFLVKSVKREVEQRERLERLTGDLALANNKLKELDKLKDEFLSFASHDLKSPVSKMKQWASLIYDNTYSTKEQIEEAAFKIQTTGDRAIRLVDEFLNIRKLEEGKMEYNFETKNLVEFVSGIVSDFMPLAKQKGLELSFKSDSHAISANIDSIKFRQVIENVIDNSLKYTEKGFVKVQIKEEQKSSLISVVDSGAGIDASVLSSLFTQFRRDPGVVKTIKGTGLGLYIAKQIMLAHKGEIWAESAGVGKGSGFYIRLPKV